MRILFFTNEYAHPALPDAGGAGSFIRLIGQELCRKGHEVHVFGFSKKKCQINDEGVKINFLKKYSKSHPFQEASRSLGARLKFRFVELAFLEKERKYLAKKLKEYVQKQRIDIVESLAFNGYMAFWDNTVPLVIRFHGSRAFWHHYLGRPKEEFKILMEQKSLEITPYSIAVSNFSAEAVKTLYNIEVDKIIHNGIDHELFMPQKNLRNIPRSVFYWGTLSNAKGLDILCHVFNEVIEEFPDATLHIIGKGRDYWEKTCRELLSEKAWKSSTYYGAIFGTDLPQLIQRASVCVLPSKNESFGLVFAEAMALEKPVIASDIPSAREIIVHNEDGFLASSQEEYVKNISQLFTDPSLSLRIGKAARSKVLRNFTKDGVISKTLEYYQQVLNEIK